jgi:hypothetical protein
MLPEPGAPVFPLTVCPERFPDSNDRAGGDGASSCAFSAPEAPSGVNARMVIKTSWGARRHLEVRPGMGNPSST